MSDNIIKFDKRFNSIKEFCDYLLSLNDNYIFRGCFDEKYKLIPGTYRFISDEKSEYGYLDAEYQHEALLKFLNHYVPDKRFEAYCNAQHYGMATKLLDFSKNSLKALVFACEAWNEPKDNDKNVNGKLYIINKNKYQKVFNPTFDLLEELLFDNDESTTSIKVKYDDEIKNIELKNIVYIDPCYKTNLKRISKQEGCFLLFPKLCQFNYEIDDKECYELFIIPNEYKKKIIEYLKEKYCITMDGFKEC